MDLAPYNMSRCQMIGAFLHTTYPLVVVLTMPNAIVFARVRGTLLGQVKSLTAESARTTWTKIICTMCTTSLKRGLKRPLALAVDLDDMAWAAIMLNDVLMGG